MHALLSLLMYFLSVFIPIFVIIDAPGLVPVYISLTERFSEKENKKIVNQAVVVAMVVLFAFAFFGNFIFDFFNISIQAFEIAGGILLFLIAIDMLFARKSRSVHSEEQEKESLERQSIAIFPLAIPLLSGPGSITTVIVLMNTAQTLVEKVMIFIAIILTFIIAKILFDKSSILMHFLGKTGLQVITRVMGIIVAAIATQFIINGVIFLIK